MTVLTTLKKLNFSLDRPKTNHSLLSCSANQRDINLLFPENKRKDGNTVIFQRCVKKIMTRMKRALLEFSEMKA